MLASAIPRDLGINNTLMISITFLGTRGEIDVRTQRHRMHTATLLTYNTCKIMIDCGRNWLGKLDAIRPDHIVLTHAHPDHAFGLKKGAPCPVWATKETWKLLKNYPIPSSQRRIIHPRRMQRIAGITFQAFPVWHSLLCPAVGYRIVCGKSKFFYVPDVVYIPDIEKAFKNILLYIGDGASVSRPLIRKSKKTEEIFGHANVRQQLTWCRKHKVPKMIVTHCGTEIVSREKRAIPLIEKYAEERSVEVKIAYDGLRILV
jgi:phosphoribosyl 1,2-cyclic phosphodiesterase